MQIIVMVTVLDSITANQVIKDGETVVSAGEMFELGFFSPANSSNRYLGIWYKKMATGTVVWVANRDLPISNTSGTFKLNHEGLLLLSCCDDTVIWSSTSSASGSYINPVAQLLDSGNFVVRDGNSTAETDFIWQSFDYPGDILLPGMKLGKDFVRGISRNLTSWKSPNDPSIGQHLIYVDTNGYPQVFILGRGSVIHVRFGPWIGIRFSCLPNEMPNPIYSVDFVADQKEVYYKYELKSSAIQMIRLKWDGSIIINRWSNRSQDWFVYANGFLDVCSDYGLCGPYASCNNNKAPYCTCLDGFEPKYPDEWNIADWSSGCQLKVPLDCDTAEDFWKIRGMKFPDTRKSWYNKSMTLGECEMACRKNCSCTTYANIDVRRGGSGCILWFDELMDLKVCEESPDLYIRMPSSLPKADGLPASQSDFNKKMRVVTITLSISLVFLGGFLVAYVIVHNKKKKRSSRRERGRRVHVLNKNYSDVEKDDLDLNFISLSKVVKATNNFSIDNKIGEGGFGLVYKGVLESGQEVAVKKLSESSQQGYDEFYNEVFCVARLQHRNLVKLLGYCMDGDERILIYEYLANKSLDLYLFDETKSSMLKWSLRLNIIHGIAKGILYLHQDSRFRIIHRDLKASNILLDHDMNPKISDFGLAREFGGDQITDNTRKVVGTYGYISPEYAIHGRFSIKSDVFSFGVMILEIVSGKKNREFSHEDVRDNLLGHAWRLYKEGKCMELMSPCLRNSCIISEVERTIHVGLLCVQNLAQDRPTMSSVVMMLSGEGALPPPNQPAFFVGESLPNSDPFLAEVDDATITIENSLVIKVDKLSMEILFTSLLISIALFLIISPSFAVDSITANQVIKDGETVVSAGEMYEMGFFSPADSTKRYLGIWYKKMATGTVVWVANRDLPLSNTSGTFKVTGEGRLLISCCGGTVIWSSSSSAFVRYINPVAQLLDTGNFVVKDRNSTNETNFIWQSFDYPGDTLLPGMKLGLCNRHNQEPDIMEESNDLSIGQYVDYEDTNGYPQAFLMHGSVIRVRYGPWVGIRFSGLPNETPNPFFSVDFVINEKEVYYKYELKTSDIQMIQLKWDGNVILYRWNNRSRDWFVFGNGNLDVCSDYGLCGPYASCDNNKTPSCTCLDGFEPKHPDEWRMADRSSGCQLKVPLDCDATENFWKTRGMKFPDTRRSWYNKSMTLGECEMACRKNCSCTAYANLDVRRGGSGCLLWFGELMDLKVCEETQDLYIRMPASILKDDGLLAFQFGFNKMMRILTVTLSISLILLGGFLAANVRKKKKKRSPTKGRGRRVHPLDKKYSNVGKDDLDLIFISLSRVVKATNNFSIDNKLGEGGFGPVYKFWNGQEIAVKKLSESSQQGYEEFYNEVVCVARLQHRNLVKLLGYCMDGDERILIYEYLANKSLDLYLFDETNMLNWPMRLNIIHGIAKGILYLHQDSRHRIIHRDLKASNILLDGNMNPKISDFGLAREFGGDQITANTKKVVGTYGYIPPEYAIHGRFSIKSDVFSFGVMVLEMVSGKKNREFSHEDCSDNLLGYAWRLYMEDRGLEIMCPSLHDTCIISEVQRTIHIGLLCVQNLAEDRPTMSYVVRMLSGDGLLPPPKQPAFFVGGNLDPNPNPFSAGVDKATITVLESR
ncbi:LOW QUALITY PROTEIN: hypothetical protein OSB04_029469 [Centaurea solstitialis]|uniref:non-specific serine/threonine protein kinase n=1 Tax=Centaurea solstitialis TaxID=347529 RepID=A0AA38T2F3_9ASTR|nr:LOW QUALITY PROTEIN: hypothetical protein OSB04_029469 [Centaurea solstitialis]